MNGPPPLQMSNFTGVCPGSGRTYVRTEDYSRAKADVARQTNLFNAWVSNQARSIQFQALNQAPVNMTQPQNRLQNMVQRFVQMLPRPLQSFIANFQQALSAPAAAVARFFTGTLPEVAETVFTGIAVLFFGKKTDRTEEKERRDQLDYGDSDLFDDALVQQSASANTGGET